jgi:hypothetical protein
MYARMVASISQPRVINPHLYACCRLLVVCTYTIITNKRGGGDENQEDGDDDDERGLTAEKRWFIARIDLEI